MKKFEVGKTYATQSICNHDCVWSYTVMERTACTVTLKDKYGEVKRYRINKRSSEYNNAETVYPLGQYSMAPSIRADVDEVAETAATTAQQCFDEAPLERLAKAAQDTTAQQPTPYGLTDDFVRMAVRECILNAAGQETFTEQQFAFLSALIENAQ